ncbi:LysE family translocator [Pontimicrobium sp. IMCC45349]|uniref:LysE family translocator n=1 Tax=Pontimicrobium sp. IMCC45349 TaxID=3391574 RepID=UPI0039A3F515
MNFELLISFVLASSMLAIFPGPDNIYVLLQSIVNGKKFGLATVAGLISGCIVHTTLVAFGVSAIIKNNDYLFTILKVIGAAYLLYLAYKVYKSNADIVIEGNVARKSVTQLFKQGFMMNVLNPKVSIFFLAFFPSFLFSDTMSSIAQFYVLGLLFMFTSFVIFSLIAILSSSISEYIKSHKNSGVVLKWLQIVVFVGIAIFIFLSEK